MGGFMEWRQASNAPDGVAADRRAHTLANRLVANPGERATVEVTFGGFSARVHGGGKEGVAIAVTGIAGPGGGSPEKPVGLVYLGLAKQGDAHAKVERHVFEGRRHDIRLQSVVRAIDLLFDAAG